MTVVNMFFQIYNEEKKIPPEKNAYGDTYL